MVALLFIAIAASTAAQAAAAQPGIAGEPEAGPSLLERYNRAIFAMNGFIYRQLDRVAPHPALQAAELSAGNFGNVVGNLVNEPISALSSVLIGDLAGAERAIRRFSINSTEGVLGYYDRATAYGLPAEQRDLGLALCARGVPDGPYVILGFVGPRTLRDAVMDIVVVNLALYSTASLVLGAGAGLATVVAIETFEVGVDIVATRQIDTRAKALDYKDFEGMRDRYLAQRAERCAALAAAMPR